MIIKTCKRCKKNYFIYPYLQNKSFYCSKECVKTENIKRHCLFCKKEIITKLARIKIGYGKYCSIKCKDNDQIGKKRPEVSGKNCHWFGKKVSLKRRREISKRNKGLIGEKSRAWKGDKVSYFGLHRWIAQRLGRPKSCSFCGLKDPKRVYDWANLSGEYTRDFKDWARLCRPCHRKYDYAKGNTNHKYTQQLLNKRNRERQLYK